jgi:acyltransferase
MTAHRFEIVDRARALGILLVILGHAPGLNALVNPIYSFHMPLFFLLAGIVLKPDKLRQPASRYGAGLLRSLGLPYLGFFALSYGYWLLTRNLGPRAAKFAGIAWSDPLQGLVSGIGADMVVNPTLWFFPCLMTVAFLYFLARRRVGAAGALAVFSALGLGCVLLADRLPVRLPLGLDNGWAALPFYALGHWLREFAPAPLRRPGCWSLAIAGLACLALTIALAEVNGRVDLNYLNFGRHPALYFPHALLGVTGAMAFAALLPATAFGAWLARNTLILFPTHPIAMNFLSGLGKLVFHLPADYFSSPEFGLLASAFAIAVCAPVPWLLRRAWPATAGRPALAVPGRRA